MSIGGIHAGNCGHDYNWGGCGGSGRGTKAHGSKGHGAEAHGSGGHCGGGSKSHGAGAHGSGGHGGWNCGQTPPPPPPVVCPPSPPPSHCGTGGGIHQVDWGHQNWGGGACGSNGGIHYVDWGHGNFVNLCNQPGIHQINWNGASFVDFCNQPGIHVVNWNGASFVDFNCHGGGQGGGIDCGRPLPPPPAQCPPPSICDGKLTFGDNTFTFNGTTLDMVNTCTGEKTCVWGDPHVTSPNGQVSTINGNFTFNLGDGTVVTVITNNGVQNGGQQAGCVAQNSYAIKVIVANSHYTATMSSNGCVAIECGFNDPASQQGLQLVECNHEWTQQTHRAVA